MSHDVTQGERPPWLRLAGAGVEIRLKVVPGSSRNAVVGVLGDRLKVKVAAPPAAGQANAAVIALIADRLGLAPSAVTIGAGQTRPEKTVMIAGIGADQVAERLPGR